MSDENELLAFARSLGAQEDEPRTRLRAVMGDAMRHNPDEYAKAIREAARTGAAPRLVAGDLPAFESRGKVDQIMGSVGPRLGRALSDDPDFAAVAHDDIPNLAGFERFGAMMSAAKPKTTGETVRDWFRQMVEGTLFKSESERQAFGQGESAVQQSAQRMGVPLSQYGPGDATTLPMSRVAAGGLRGVIRPFAGLVRHVERKAGLNTGIGKAGQALVEALSPSRPTVADTGAENFGSTLGLLIPSMGFQKGASLLTKIPALAKVPRLLKAVEWGAGSIAMAIPEAASEAEDAYDQNVMAGMSPELANEVADGVFIKNLALLTATGKIAWFSKGIGLSRRAAAEAVEEGGQQIIGNVATGRPTFEGAVEAAAMGGAIGTALPLLGDLGRKMLRTRGARFATPLQLETFDSMVQAANESKLLQRAPEVFEAKAQQIFDGTNHENVLVDAGTFQTYFQGLDMDPEQVASEVGATNYAEALAAGTDLVIPTGSYLGKLSKDHHAGLSMDIKFGLDDLSMREMEEVKVERDKLMSEITAQGQEDAAEVQQAPGWAEIYEATRQDLVDAGDTDKVADTRARLHAKAMVRLAERRGMDPLDLHERYGLVVTGPQAGESRLQMTDIVLNRLRARQERRAAQADMEQAGTMDALGGALEAVGIDPAQAPEAIRQQLREAAADPARAQGAETAQAALRAAGQEVLLQGTSEPEFSPVDTNSEAFKSWFGGSKAVDGEGNPLVVQHGTDASFGAFDQDRLGSNTMSNNNEVSPYTETSKIGFWFADRGANGIPGNQSVPVHLKIENPARFDSLAELADAVETAGSGEALRDELKAAGHDGVILQDEEFVTTSYVVFEATQIKSAISNTGDFDPTNPNILMQRDPKPDKLAKRGLIKSKTKAERMAFRRSMSYRNMMAAYAKVQRAEMSQEEAAFQAFEDELKAIQVGTTVTGEGKGNRAFIQWGPDRKMHIGLLENADPTSFIHEAGHMYLEVFGDLAQEEGAPQEMQDDYAKILKFLGVTERGQITTKEHEKWARAHEAYLMEGKAPSEDLRDVFARVKSWMLMIYRRLRALNVKLNPEVREVFDRLYASQVEIDAAKETLQGQGEMFATAADMGVTQEEFEAYRKMSLQERQTADDALAARLMTELRRKKTQWWKEQLGNVTQSVTGDVEADANYQALQAILSGQTSDGDELKLSLKAVTDQFGKSGVQELPPNVRKALAKEGGVDADTVAEIYGLQSGVALFEWLKVHEAPKTRIKRLAEQTMHDRHGDMLNDGTIAEEAMEAIHNEARGRKLEAELKALKRAKRAQDPIDQAREGGARQSERDRRKEGKAAAEAVPPPATWRAAAKDILANMRVMDITPHRYIQAQAKYSRAAFQAAAKGDFGKAVDAQQKAMLNHYLYTESVKIRDEVAAAFKLARRYSRASVREAISEAGGEQGQHVFMDQIDKILERFQFVKATNKAIERQALADFVEQRGEDGIDIDPQAIAAPKNYRELKIDELRAVVDALKNIEHVARKMGKGLDEQERERFDNEVEDFVKTSARSITKRKKVLREGTRPKGLDAIVRKLLGFEGWAGRLEWWVDELDGGDIEGPARRNIKKPIDDAEGRFQAMAHRIFTGLKALEDARPERDVKDMDQSTGITFPGDADPLSRLQLVGWALNLGNEENRKVALQGEELVEEDGVTLRPEFEQALKEVRPSEWTYIQGVWDLLDGMREDVRVKTLRATGVEPKWKTETPFQVLPNEGNGQEVQLRGGYYPLKASRVRGRVGVAQEIGDIAAEGRQRPKTFTSHTKKVTGATYRLNLDYTETLGRHLLDVIKDTTTGEAVQDVYKFLTSDRVRQAMQERLGQEIEPEFMTWLQDYNQGHRNIDDSSNPIVNWLMKRKGSMVVARLGGNISSMAMQLLDPLKVLSDKDFKAGPMGARLLRAYADVRRNPAETIKMIRDLSPNEMRFREENFNRDIRDLLTNEGWFEGKRKGASLWFMQAFQVMDRVHAFPIWLARFRQGIEEHGDQARAVAEADRLVARGLQTGSTKNMSRLLRDKGAWRILTAFQGDASVWYGILSSAVRSGSVGRVSKVLLLLLAEQALASAIRGRLPDADDDEKEKAKWAAETVVTAIAGKLPGIGDLVNAGVQVAGGRRPEFNVPALAAVSKALNAASGGAKWLDDEKEFEDVAMDTVEAVGLYAGIPGTSQLVKTWRFKRKVEKGDATAETVPEVVMGAVMGGGKK